MARALEVKLMVNFVAIVNSKGDAGKRKCIRVHGQRVVLGPLLSLPVDVQVCQFIPHCVCAPITYSCLCCSDPVLHEMQQNVRATPSTLLAPQVQSGQGAGTVRLQATIPGTHVHDDKHQIGFCCRPCQSLGSVVGAPVVKTLLRVGCLAH
jgi:hypothetical protein